MNETLQGEIWIFKWLPLNDHYTPQSEKVDEWVHFPLKPTEESGWFESIDQSHPPPVVACVAPWRPIVETRSGGRSVQLHATKLLQLTSNSSKRISWIYSNFKRFCMINAIYRLRCELKLSIKFLNRIKLNSGDEMDLIPSVECKSMKSTGISSYFSLKLNFQSTPSMERGGNYVVN